MEERITANFDGGSRGNPGPAGIGILLEAADGTPLVTLGRFVGRATNNVAEYMALIAAMQEAKKLGAKKLLVRGDSELIIKQMRGEYRVKNPGLKEFYDQAQKLAREFAEIKFEHNLRHHNELADKLANMAMDRRGEVRDLDWPAAGQTDLGRPVRENRAGENPDVNHRGAIFFCEECGCEITVTKPSSKPAARRKPFVCHCGNEMKE